MSETQNKIYKSTSDLKGEEIRAIYNEFNSPIAEFDCGKKCAPHNPSGKPFCCDICHAVPAAYKSEWNYLEHHTNLWHKWRGDECEDTTSKEVARIKVDTPKNMILLACLGPSQCQRDFRALSCRQFPYFPYVTSDYRFIGLAYEWEFESKCWVISNLLALHKNTGKNLSVPMTNCLHTSRRNSSSMLIIQNGCVIISKSKRDGSPCCIETEQIIW